MTPDTFSTRLAGFYPNLTGIQSLNSPFLLYPVALIGAFTNKTQFYLPVRNILSQCERFILYCLMKSYLSSSNSHMLLKTRECWISCNNNMSNTSIKHHFMVIRCMRNSILWNCKGTLESVFSCGWKRACCLGAITASRVLQSVVLFWRLLLSYCKHNNWNWKQILVLIAAQNMQQ